MKFIDGDTIRQLISMSEIISAISDLYHLDPMTDFNQPERIHMHSADGKNTSLFMPAAVPSLNGLGIKVVSVFPENKSKGQPMIEGAIMLLSPETGEILAFLDARVITAMRTAAVSAVAADKLALPNAKTLGIFGTGVQARTHIAAMKEVRSVERILVHGHRQESTESFVDDMAKDGVTVEIAGSPKDLLAAAQIIVTVTPSVVPLFDAFAVRPGTHIAAVGSFKPEDREIDTATVQKSRLFIDGYHTAPVEAGEIVIPLEAGDITKEHILGDLHELVSGKVVGRESDSDITLFKSVGMAVQDIAVARKVYDSAVNLGVGTDVTL